MSNEAPTDALRLVPRRATPQQLEAAAFNLSAEIGAAEAMKLGPHIERAYELLVAAAPTSPLPGGGDMDWSSVAMWMGFSASVIKNGEPWSDQCQQHYDEAKAAFARLAAPTGEPK